MNSVVHQKRSIKYRLYHFYFLNIDISITTKVCDLNFSVCVLKVPVEGKVSGILN